MIVSCAGTRDNHPHSLQVSGNYEPIIRRNSCVYATLGTSYSVPTHATDRHTHRITSTTCRINTVVSSDDGPIVVRNM